MLKPVNSIVPYWANDPNLHCEKQAFQLGQGWTQQGSKFLSALIIFLTWDNTSRKHDKITLF